MVVESKMQKVAPFFIYPKQGRFAELTENITGFVSGRGGGKSLIGAHKLIKIAKNDRLYLVGAPCYDDQTEILTEDRGWQLFRNLLISDKVATLSDGESIKYEKPKKVFNFPYSGDMVYLANQELDIAMTPNHRCHVKFKKGGKWQIKTADELYGKYDWRFKKTAKWKSGSKKYSEAYFEYLGFWFAEGCAEVNTKSRKYRTVVTQTDQVEYAERVVTAFAKECNGGKYSKDPKESGFNFTIYNKAVAHEFVKYGKSKTKSVPLFVKKASVKLLKAFLRGFIHGDGHFKEGTHDQTQARTTSKQLADDLQEIGFKCGFSSCLSKHANGSYYLCFRTEKKNEPSTKKKHWSRKPYKGRVRCVEVESGIVYVRRNGKPVWCGNTYVMLDDACHRTFVQHAERFGRLIASKGSTGQKWAKIMTVDRKRTPSEGSAEVIFRTASEPDRWRGPNLSGIWLDEASVMIREAMDIALACLREGSELGWMSLTFTPKGKHHWTYEAFYDKYGNPRPGTALIQAHSNENPFLPAGFVDMLSGQYSTELQMQELAGLFVEMAGIMFRREWFDIVESAPLDGKRVRYWDKAFTEGGDGAASAGVLMNRCKRTGVFFIEDIAIGRWSPAARNQIIKQTAILDANKFGVTNVEIWVEQEPAAGKESALISMHELAGFPAFRDPVQTNKPERARPLQAQAEIRNVKVLNDGGRGGLEGKGWNEEFLYWISVFPEGKMKDMVDAASGALTKLSLDFLRPKPRAQGINWPPTAEQVAEYEKAVKAMPEEQRKHLESKRSELVKYLMGKRR